MTTIVSRREFSQFEKWQYQIVPHTHLVTRHFDERFMKTTPLEQPIKNVSETSAFEPFIAFLETPSIQIAVWEQTLNVSL